MTESAPSDIHGILTNLRGIGGAVRRTQRHVRMLLKSRISHDQVRDGLERLGVRRGDLIFVHSALSRLGYVVGGPQAVVRATIGAVGPRGTVAAPSFPFSGSMEHYVTGAPVFDVWRTPSACGGFTEVLRRQPGAVRSVHPTHPVCAIGLYARDLVHEHEKVGSPCGQGSPFAKLAAAGGKVLRIGTGALTMYHHVQELVGFPNLFLNVPARLRVVHDGHESWVETAVYRAAIPNLIWINTSRGREPVHPSNFPALFPGDREWTLRDSGRSEVLARLLDLRAELASTRAWSHLNLNGCVCDLLSAREYIDIAVREYRRALALFRSEYQLEELQELYSARAYPAK